jgi:hypothetical protein
MFRARQTLLLLEINKPGVQNNDPEIFSLEESLKSIKGLPPFFINYSSIAACLATK